MPDQTQTSHKPYRLKLPLHRIARARRALGRVPAPAARATSPLMVCDRLITLAQEADRAGLAVTAGHLVHLARGVFDESPTRQLA